MRLRNVLIAVNDMDRAIKFYKEIFGLQVILEWGGNAVISEGLVLQDGNLAEVGTPVNWETRDSEEKILDIGSRCRCSYGCRNDYLLQGACACGHK